MPTHLMRSFRSLIGGLQRCKNSYRKLCSFSISNLREECILRRKGAGGRGSLGLNYCQNIGRTLSDICVKFYLYVIKVKKVTLDIQNILK